MRVTCTSSGFWPLERFSFRRFFCQSASSARLSHPPQSLMMWRGMASAIAGRAGKYNQRPIIHRRRWRLISRKPSLRFLTSSTGGRRANGGFAAKNREVVLPIAQAAFHPLSTPLWNTLGMRQLLYVSNTAPEISLGELDNVLTSSRRNNALLGITGLLLFIDGGFLQVLEGEERAVRELYTHISSDPRHWNPKLMLDREVPARAFPNWSMGFERPCMDDPE